MKPNYTTHSDTLTEEIRSIDEQLESLADAYVTVCDLLNQRTEIDPKHCVPQKFYEASARATPQAAIELVVLKWIGERPHVYLAKRPDDDPEWPGEWHFPGTTMRNYDDLDRDMWPRLLKDELGGIDLDPELKFIHTTSKHDRGRGACLHVVYTATVSIETEIRHGEFFPINNLPDNTIGHHVDMIRKLERLL